MRYWIGKLNTRKLTEKDPVALPEPERRLPTTWIDRRSCEEFSVGDRVVVWRSSRLNRAVGVAEIGAVSPAGSGSGAELSLRTVQMLWHTIVSGEDLHEVPAYALFNRPEPGELALLTPVEAQLLIRHLMHSNGRLATLGWLDERDATGDAAGPPRFDPAQIADARKATLSVVVQRQGQSDFRAALLAAYRFRCCISNCDIVPLLEAAHIVPYIGPGTNHVQNGLLLRADLHALFDLGLLAIAPDTLTVRIHESIRGSEYSRFDGARVDRPANEDSGPSTEALQLREKMFLAETEGDKSEGEREC